MSEKISYNLQREYEVLDTIHENKVSSVKFKYAKDLNLFRYVGIKEFPLEIRRLDQIRQETITNINFSKITPFIPQIYEMMVDKKKNKVYIVSQYVGKRTLRNLISKGNIDDNKALFMIKQIVNILDAIGERYNNINHRDLKPENILLDDADNIYLIDFGLTFTPPIYGEGTRGYQAPEQKNGNATDRFLKVDQYSLGLIFCELLLGHVPQYGVSFVDLNETNKNSLPLVRELKEKGYTDGFITFIFKLLSSNPEKRYRNYKEMKAQLQGFQKRGFKKVNDGKVNRQN